MEMEMGTEAERRRSRRKGGGGGVLGKRRETSKPQADDDEEEAAEPELGKQGSKSSLLPSVEDGLKVWSKAHIELDEEFLAIAGMTAEEYAAFKADAASKPKRKENAEEGEARIRKSIEEQDRKYREEIGSVDYEDWKVIQYRRFWNDVWSPTQGSFEDTTRIPPMRFTHKPPQGCTAYPSPTLQIFSVKVAATKGGLQWPLDVFGMIAMRDSLDRNRNIIFHRTRDNCQSLTEEDRNLVLVGPTRVVALMMPEPVIIEVELKVKGTTESGDKDLSFLAEPLLCDDTYYSRVLNSGSYSSKLSTLEFRLGYIAFSVEATISVRVISGSWPDGFRGQFAAFTTCTRCKDMTVATIDNERIVLHDSRGEKVVVTGDGKIDLSRCVVSVESEGELKVSVKAWKDDNNIVEKVKVFTPLEAGLSDGMVDIGFCKLEIVVAWSLISEYPVLADSVL